MDETALKRGGKDDRQARGKQNRIENPKAMTCVGSFDHTGNIPINDACEFLPLAVSGLEQLD